MIAANVASLDVSRELYSLSNWVDHAARYCWAKVHPQDKAVLTRSGTPVWTWWPCYDTGYLLRKLAPAVQLRYAGPDTWVASGLQCEGGAKTPEDALGILAIKLLEEKKITPGPVL